MLFSLRYHIIPYSLYFLISLFIRFQKKMYFCRSIHERQEFGYTKTLLRKQRTSVIFYSMDKNERIYNEQEMPAETKRIIPLMRIE